MYAHTSSRTMLEESDLFELCSFDYWLKMAIVAVNALFWYWSLGLQFRLLFESGSVGGNRPMPIS